DVAPAASPPVAPPSPPAGAIPVTQASPVAQVAPASTAASHPAPPPPAAPQPSVEWSAAAASEPAGAQSSPVPSAAAPAETAPEAVPLAEPSTAIAPAALDPDDFVGADIAQEQDAEPDAEYLDSVSGTESDAEIAQATGDLATAKSLQASEAAPALAREPVV